MADLVGELNQWVQASRGAVGLFKSLVGLMPKGQEADSARQRVEEAERALKASEAQLAQSLGYKLCRCTFPPQIMLTVGRHSQYGDEIFRCPICGNQEPTARTFQQRGQTRAVIDD